MKRSAAAKRGVSAGRKGCVLGIDVGGTNIRAGLVHLPSGSIELAHATRTEAALGKRHSLHQLAVAAGEAVLMGRKRGIRVTRVGIGLPELIGRSGSIDSHATLKWHADDVRKLLSTYGPVTVESDVRAAALAEASLGRGRGLASVLYVTVGTGISCTLVVDGRPYAGAHGHAISFASGPVFPLAGLNGATQLESLEARAAGPGLVKRAQALGAPDTDSFAVCRVAQKQAGPQRDAVDAATAELALHVAVVANALDPAIILLGGGLGSAPGYYWTRLRTQVRRHLWGPNARRLPVQRAALGGASGLIGAALSAALQVKRPGPRA
jgi:glucokinase